MIFNIRRIIEYIYIPGPIIYTSPSQKKDKERVKKLEDTIAHIQALMAKVKSPVIAGKIQEMIDQVRDDIKAGNISDAENAIDDIEKYAKKAADLTQNLEANIGRAKTLMWSLPAHLRGSLGVLIKAAEKMLANGGDLQDMERMNKTMERAVMLASKIADAGPGGLHSVAHEIRELATLANDVATLGTDHLALSDAAASAGQGKTGALAEAAKAPDAPLPFEKAAESGRMLKPGKPKDKKKKDPATGADVTATVAERQQVAVPRK